MLGQAFLPEGDERLARAGALFTDAVSKWTALMLLRFRYRLVEATEEFPEEIVLAAFERGGNVRLLVLKYGRSSFASA